MLCTMLLTKLQYDMCNLKHEFYKPAEIFLTI